MAHSEGMIMKICMYQIGRKESNSYFKSIEFRLFYGETFAINYNNLIFVTTATVVALDIVPVYRKASPIFGLHSKSKIGHTEKITFMRK